MSRVYADDEIHIVYGAKPSVRCKGAWAEYVEVNGKGGHPAWQCRSYDEAVAVAEVLAREEADRYLGDWRITVERRYECACAEYWPGQGCHDECPARKAVPHVA